MQGSPMVIQNIDLAYPNESLCLLLTTQSSYVCS